MTIERVHHETARSTNDIARDLWRAGRRDPILITAAEQTAGRGRMGRAWHSTRGGAWMSLLWPHAESPSDDPDITPLLAGLSIAEAVEHVAPSIHPQIKWPNDVLIDGAKLAGVLCERELTPRQTGGSGVVIGIGINVNNQLPLDLPDGFLPATSLSLLTGRDADLDNVIAFTLDRLVEHLTSPAHQALPYIGQRLAYTDELVNIAVGDQTLRGAFRGIDTHGRAVVDISGTRHAFASGEIRMRPACEPVTQEPHAIGP